VGQACGWELLAKVFQRYPEKDGVGRIPGGKVVVGFTVTGLYDGLCSSQRRDTSKYFGFKHVSKAASYAPQVYDLEGMYGS